MKIISSWFTASLLPLNLKKTNYILFGNKKLPDTCIKLNNVTISRVYQTKFLGVLIQSNLKWNEHISSIANKISKVIRIINKIKHTLSTDHLKLRYQSLIQPYLNYCCIVWASPQKILHIQHCIPVNSKNARSELHYYAVTMIILNLFS